jgi:hypothetical protein
MWPNPPGPLTPQPCRRTACDNGGIVVCGYVDRRGRACPTRWCWEHCIVLGGHSFCARHASTLIAIGGEETRRTALPELENRVPSLVYWVGRDMDADVRSLLQRLVNAAAGEGLAADPVTLVSGGGRNAERRWEQNWKILSHTGFRHRVTVQVLEVAPVEIAIRVGQRLLVRETPPWIGYHLRGEDVEGDVDAVARTAFYVRLHQAISKALAEDPLGRTLYYEDQ